MATASDSDQANKSRELMERVARNPIFYCGCFQLSDEDKKRAKRVFRIVRGAMRSWQIEGRLAVPGRR